MTQFSFKSISSLLVVSSLLFVSNSFSKSKESCDIQFEDEIVAISFEKAWEQLITKWQSGIPMTIKHELCRGQIGTGFGKNENGEALKKYYISCFLEEKDACQDLRDQYRVTPGYGIRELNNVKK